MGFASMREDIVERFNASMPTQYVRPPTRATRKAREFSLEQIAEAYKHYVGKESNERTRSEALEIVGDPFRRAIAAVSELLSQLKSERPPVSRCIGPWAAHAERLSELDLLLDDGLRIEPEEPRALERVEVVEAKLQSLCMERSDLGPVRPALAARAAELTRRHLGSRDRMVERIRACEHALADLDSHEREKSLLHGLILQLSNLDPPLEPDAIFLDDFARLSGRVEEKWPRFVAHYRACLLGGHFRPRLGHLNRLLLEHSQERYVTLDHGSAYRLSGVSGSGKTIVLLHRALRLAWEYPLERIAVLTLNRSLVHVLRSAARAIHGAPLPQNMVFKSAYDVSLACLKILDPRRGQQLFDHYSAEHVGSNSWRDFVQHVSTNRAVNVFADPLVVELVGRLAERLGGWRKGIAYLRDEVRYIQSIYSPAQRTSYGSDARKGRHIVLGKNQRRACLRVVSAWEEYLEAGGFCDPDEAAGLVEDQMRKPSIGGATDLQRRVMEDTGFQRILVDECQDLSTIELRMLSHLVPKPASDNAMFFAGDMQQKVSVRHHSFARAGIEISGRRGILQRNFRNTRQILDAAYSLASSFPADSDDAYEILDPERSAYEGRIPMALRCASADQVSSVLALARGRRGARTALLSDNDELLRHVMQAASAHGIEVLEVLENIDSYRETDSVPDATRDGVYVGRLASAKGFEFDTVIIADFSEGVVPSDATPVSEWWRAAAVAYVAMTRAREELFITHVDEGSPFLSRMERFVDRRDCPSSRALASVLAPRS